MGDIGRRWLSQPVDAQHAGQHREGELAVGGLRFAREESADPAERGLSFLVWHDEHPCARRDRRDEGVGGSTLPARELGPLRRAEPGDASAWKAHVCRRGAPAAARVTRADGGVPADPRESGSPADPVIDDVLQAAQDAARCEVEHPRAGRGLEHPAHRGLCVVRAVLGVRGRRGAERRAVTKPFALVHALTLSVPRWGAGDRGDRAVLDRD